MTTAVGRCVALEARLGRRLTPEEEWRQLDDVLQEALHQQTIPAALLTFLETHVLAAGQGWLVGSFVLWSLMGFGAGAGAGAGIGEAPAVPADIDVWVTQSVDLSAAAAAGGGVAKCVHTPGPLTLHTRDGRSFQVREAVFRWEGGSGNVRELQVVQLLGGDGDTAATVLSRYRDFVDMDLCGVAWAPPPGPAAAPLAAGGRYFEMARRRRTPLHLCDARPARIVKYGRRGIDFSPLLGGRLSVDHLHGPLHNGHRFDLLVAIADDPGGAPCCGRPTECAANYLRLPHRHTAVGDGGGEAIELLLPRLLPPSAATTPPPPPPPTPSHAPGAIAYPRQQ